MPEGVLLSSKGVLSNPKGVLSNPKGVLPNPKGVLLSPTNVLSSSTDVLLIPKKCCLIKDAQSIHRICKSKCKTAVLVAIAIPVFTSQLEKSREATDLANVRSAYAELVTAAMTEETSIVSNSADITYTVDTATVGSYVYTATVKLHQAIAGWATTDADKAVSGVTATGSPTAKGTATITFTENTELVEIKYA